MDVLGNGMSRPWRGFIFGFVSLIVVVKIGVRNQLALIYRLSYCHCLLINVFGNGLHNLLGSTFPETELTSTLGNTSIDDLVNNVIGEWRILLFHNKFEVGGKLNIVPLLNERQLLLFPFRSVQDSELPRHRNKIPALSRRTNTLVLCDLWNILHFCLAASCLCNFD